MVQSPTETLAEAAQTALAEDHAERDREAWNLPRASAATSGGAYQDGLDWDGFRDLYYPDSRRHDLTAIGAYGAYRGSPAAIATEAVSLEEWEDEGGTPH